MKRNFVIYNLLLCTAFAIDSQASEPGMSMGIGVGSTGLDLAISHPISEQLALRGVVSGFSLGFKSNLSSNNDFDSKLKLFNAAALIDYHPFSDCFRLTTGLVYNNSKLQMTARARNGQYDLHGTNYSTNEINNLDGAARWRKPGFYIGMGFGSSNKKTGLSLSGDAGVIYTGAPTVSLSASCGAGLNANQCDQLQRNLNAEAASMRTDISYAKLWPVARIMLNYSF